jgi:hypothetical protein
MIFVVGVGSAIGLCFGALMDVLMRHPLLFAASIALLILGRWLDRPLS